MNNKYFLMRHGQTIYQTEKDDFIYPWPEPEPILLTEKGRKEVQETAKELKKENIDLLFSSDIPRTKETAGIVSVELNLVPQFDIRLREVNFGNYSGGLISSFYQDIHTQEERFYKKPENGENRKEIKERLMSFVSETEEKHQGKNILLISHGDPLMLLKGIIKGLKTDEEFISYMQKEKLPNTAEVIKI